MVVKWSFSVFWWWSLSKVLLHFQRPLEKFWETVSVPYNSLKTLPSAKADGKPVKDLHLKGLNSCVVSIEDMINRGNHLAHTPLDQLTELGLPRIIATRFPVETSHARIDPSHSPTASFNSSGCMSTQLGMTSSSANLTKGYFPRGCELLSRFAASCHTDAQRSRDTHAKYLRVGLKVMSMMAWRWWFIVTTRTPSVQTGEYYICCKKKLTRFELSTLPVTLVFIFSRKNFKCE